MNTALFVGRFQPLHKGHVKVIRDLVEKFDVLKIVIGSSQESNTDRNPFSFEQRKKMIEIVLKGYKISNVKLFAVDDVGVHSVWLSNLINKVGDFDVVYTGNKFVASLFKEKGLMVKLIEETEESSTRIRKLISEGGAWQSLVSKAVVECIQKL